MAHLDIRKGESSLVQINNDITRKIKEFASENATTLLTAGAVVGTVGTGILAGRAGYKYKELIDKAEYERTHDEHGDLITHPDMPIRPMTKLEKAQAAGIHVIPPVVTGGLTITAIIFANRMSAQKAAALAAAYGLLENRFEDYRDKVSEKLTGPKQQQVKDEIAQDKIDNNPVSKQVVILAGGDMLCYDTISGRYFRSSVERVKRAESEINQELFDAQMASVSDFYDKIGLPRTTMSDMLGWSAYDDGIVEFEISTMLTDDKQPCIVITPSRLPEANYTRRFHD